MKTCKRKLLHCMSVVARQTRRRKRSQGATSLSSSTGNILSNLNQEVAHWLARCKNSVSRSLQVSLEDMAFCLKAQLRSSLLHQEKNYQAQGARVVCKSLAEKAQMCLPQKALAHKLPSARTKAWLKEHRCVCPKTLARKLPSEKM